MPSDPPAMKTPENNRRATSAQCGAASAPATPAALGGGWLARRPWLWIVAAFVVLFSAWTVFIIVALKHQPETVPLVDAHDRPGD